MDISVHELTLERILKLEMHSSLKVYSRKDGSRSSDVIEKINSILDTKVCLDDGHIQFHNRQYKLTGICDRKLTFLRVNG